MCLNKLIALSTVLVWFKVRFDEEGVGSIVHLFVCFFYVVICIDDGYCAAFVGIDNDNVISFLEFFQCFDFGFENVFFGLVFK